MNQIIINRAGIDDAIVLQDLAELTFRETYANLNTPENLRQYIEDNFTADKLKKELNNPESYFFIAFEGSVAIGYIKLNTGGSQTEKQAQNYIELERIYVPHSHQGKKIGQLLYKKAMEVAQLQDKEFIWLGVWEKNLKAIGFYEKNGFVPFDKHIFKLGNDEQTDIMMRKKTR